MNSCWGKALHTWPGSPHIYQTNFSLRIKITVSWREVENGSTLLRQHSVWRLDQSKQAKREISPQDQNRALNKRHHSCTHSWDLQNYLGALLRALPACHWIYKIKHWFLVVHLTEYPKIIAWRAKRERIVSGQDLRTQITRRKSLLGIPREEAVTWTAQTVQADGRSGKLWWKGKGVSVH